MVLFQTPPKWAVEIEFRFVSDTKEDEPRKGFFIRYEIRSEKVTLYNGVSKNTWSMPRERLNLIAFHMDNCIVYINPEAAAQDLAWTDLQFRAVSMGQTRKNPDIEIDLEGSIMDPIRHTPRTLGRSASDIVPYQRPKPRLMFFSREQPLPSLKEV